MPLRFLAAALLGFAAKEMKMKMDGVQTPNHKRDTMTISRMNSSVPLVLVVMLATLSCQLVPCALAFQRPCVLSLFASRQARTSTTASPPDSSTSTVSRRVVWDPSNTDDSLVEFPTFAQRKVLTKEAKKRKARNELTRFNMPPDYGDDEPETMENPLFSKETIDQLAQLLKENELVEVRAVSIDAIKQVFDTLNLLCFELSSDMQNQVALVYYKGHSGVLYSPMDYDVDETNSNPSRIKLRTSVGQKNVWTKRVKAPRDARGRIVKDELRVARRTRKIQ